MAGRSGGAIVMTFEEAQRHLESLIAQFRQGQISQEQFREEANRLQVQDETGRWWQPDPSGSGWLVWDGAAWQPQIPPQPQFSPGPAPPAYAAAAPAPESAKAGLAATIEKRRAGQFMDPQAFLEISRRLPLARRPQAWWNLLSVLGGAGSGYLWFVYGSVRGMPHLKFMQQGRESWLDWLPAIVLAVLPLLAIVFRRALAKRLTALWTRLAKLPLPAKLVILAAALTFLVLFGTTNFLFTQREGLDIITPILMAGIPLLLVLFRSETDRVLLPFQSLRRSIPRGVLVGIGLALPFLIAFFLYYVAGLSMYPLLRANVLVGTLGSYALLRNPVMPASQRWTIPRIPGILLAVGVFLYFVAPALADDFLRDPFNLNDGLRTDGIAPVLSGVATAVVSILVNGVEVAQVMIQGTTQVAEGEEPEHKNFLVVVNTMDKTGARSTAISRENEGVYIYAHCEEVGKGRFPSGDSTIQYALVDAQTWVTLTDMGTQNNERCAHVALSDSPPANETPPESCSVHVSAGAGGGLIGATIQLTLSQNEWELQIL
jgi:hypothetical protein